MPSAEGSAEPHPRSAFWLLLAGLALVFGTVLRVLASLGDLWLDEIWSVMRIRALEHWWSVPLEVHHDTDHVLNTWWLWMIGNGRHELLYRLPAIVGGVASIVLCALVTREQVRRSERSSAGTGARSLALGATVMAASYMMIHYSSEARGYASAVAFGLLAVYAALRNVDWRGTRWTALYWASMVLALLSHALVVHVMAGVGIWQMVEGLRRGSRAEWLGRLRRLALWQGPVLAFFAWYYLYHLSRMEVGGGPKLDPWLVLANAVSYTFGLPTVPFVALGLAVGVLLSGLALWIGQGRHSSRLEAETAPRDAGRLVPGRSWALYLGSIVVGPILVVIAANRPSATSHPSGPFERYFLIEMVMLLVLAGVVLEFLARSGRSGRVLATASVALFIVGNHAHTDRLLRLGRGEYSRAVAEILRGSSTRVITVGSNHHLAGAMVLEYYSGSSDESAPRLVYLADPSVYPPEGPQWFIWCWQWQEPRPPAQVGSMRLAATYEYAAMSGFNWSVYSRNRDTAATFSPAP